jgi:thiol-disulfide isomerase/thioredoxin
MTAAIFGTVLVVLVVLVIVLVGVTGSKGGGKTSGKLGVTTAPADVVSALTGAPASAFTAAGSTASSSGPFLQFLSAPKNQPPLTQGGKPVVVYLGSNWCPYCGATRWPLTVALSRFGTFKNLKMTSSSSSDVDPSTNTLSYYKSSYKSPYIVFLPTEQCTNIASSSDSEAVRACNGYEPLPGPFSKLAIKTFKKYDFAPFQTGGTNGNSGGIPFIDFGNKVIEDGAFIDPAILSGQSHLQIAQSLSDPVANPGQTILVGANYYSALICNITNNRPGSVCDMPVVKNAAKALKAEKLLP